MFQFLYLVSTNFCVYVHQMIKERTVRRCQAVGECCRLDGLDLVKTILEATDIKRKMKRSKRMLSMAKAKSKVDEEIGRMLDIPKYETTKGLEATEIDLLLQVQHQLFNVVKSNVQICEVTSTEKRPITRFFITIGAKRNLFCNSDASEYSHLDVDTVTSSVVESDSEPYVDSGDEFKPEEISESDSDNSEISESPFSLKDADTHKKNKKNIGSKRKLNKIDISESPFSLKDADTHKKNKKNIGSKRKLNKQMQSNDPTEASEILNVDNKVLDAVTKRKGVWDKRDHCYFCDLDVLKFSRHVLRHHQSEIEVQEILALNVKDKRRRILFQKLRNRGNFLKSTISADVVPVRKPAYKNLDKPSPSTYLPCKYCRGFYKNKYLCRHMKRCPLNNDDKSERVNAQSEGQSLFSTYRENDVLRKDIFPTMRADEISFVAKTDPLICAVARRYLKVIVKNNSGWLLLEKCDSWHIYL
ncbi:unnamed protein product [Tenebrio molitor]|nr:unnamed protein product [Tenebrio molitor]